MLTMTWETVSVLDLESTKVAVYSTPGGTKNLA